MKRWVAIAMMLSACAKHPVSEQDWEGALERYKQSYARDPQDSMARKIETASAKVVEAHAAKGARARQQGWMLEAGAHWGKAFALCTPRVNPPACTEVAASLRRDVSALEISADEAAKKSRYEEAAAVYDAILLVMPDRVGVAEKNLSVQRAFASSLQDRAKGLERRKMLGAAWAMNVRALSHDPMQEDAFRAGSGLEKSMRSRAKVAVQDIAIDAKKGDKKFASAIARSLRPHLDDVKPYGPTRDPKAVKATFRAKIVKVVHDDATVAGFERHKNDDDAKIANPAYATQKTKIAKLKTSLAKLEKAKKKSPKKIAATKKSLQAAKTKLASIPSKIDPPATWDLAWKDVTRSVEATVRFELVESDMAQPLVLEVTRRVERTDRTHRGNVKHGIDRDPLSLPSRDALVRELSQQFGDGASLLASALDRRVKSRLEKGRTRLAAGRPDEALDAFVEVLFLAGPHALGDADAAFVARSMERDEVETLLASN